MVTAAFTWLGSQLGTHTVIFSNSLGMLIKNIENLQDRKVHAEKNVD